MVNASAELELRLIARDEMSKVFKNASKEGKGFSGVLDGITKVAGGFLAANVVQGAADKFIGFLGDSTKAASDLGESINAVQTIFGTSADKILEWGDKSANAYGLSQRAFNQLATPLGAALKNMGFSQDEVAKSTISLTERASDMASVFNTTVPDALEAINSALRGEANPIERYGVSVNAAKVEMQALADTGKTSAASLTETEKAAARLKLIFEQTAPVAGDFAKTSDQNANAARIASAKYEEMQAVLGQKLLPIQLKVTEAKVAFIDFMITKGIPTLESLYAKYWPGISEAIGEVVQIIKDLTPVWQFMAEEAIAKIEGLMEVAGGLVAGWKEIIGGVKALIDGDWQLAWDHFKEIPSIVLDIMLGLIQSTLGTLPDKMYGAAVDAMDGFKKGLNAKLGELTDWVDDKLGGIPGRVMGLFKENSPSKVFEDIGKNVVQGLINGLKMKEGDLNSMFDQLVKIGNDKGNSLVNNIQRFLGLAEDAAGDVARVLAGLDANSGALTQTQANKQASKLTKKFGAGNELLNLTPNTGIVSAGGARATVVNNYIGGSVLAENDLNSIIRNSANNGGYRGVL